MASAGRSVTVAISRATSRRLGGARLHGRDREGNPTQVSRTVHGTERDAQRVTAELTVKPALNAGGGKVGQLLDEWLEIRAPSWAPLTVRDQTSRSTLIQHDPIASMSVASLGASDIDRWAARLRKSGTG